MCVKRPLNERITDGEQRTEQDRNSLLRQWLPNPTKACGKTPNWGAEHERSTEAPEPGTEPVFPTSTREKKVANGKERRAKVRERYRGVERAGAALISENL